jgi:hypothetical protein
MDPRSSQQVGEIACLEEELIFAKPEYSSQTDSPYVPKWKNIPRCGASFGFGGKLVTFHGKCLKMVTQIQHHTEKELVKNIQEFDQ